MSKPTELLPCPCCAGEAIGAVVLQNAKPLRNIYHRYVVKCDVCALSTFKFSTREEAIEAWNRRANRWHAFTLEELDKIIELKGHSDRQPFLIGEILDEMNRREGEGK